METLECGHEIRFEMREEHPDPEHNPIGGVSVMRYCAMCAKERGAKFYCSICGRELDIVAEGTYTCDYCWYGMRLRPAAWRKELKERGIEVERINWKSTGNVIICGDGWRKKTRALAASLS